MAGGRCGGIRSSDCSHCNGHYDHRLHYHHRHQRSVHDGCFVSSVPSLRCSLDAAVAAAVAAADADGDAVVVVVAVAVDADADEEAAASGA